MMMKEDVVVDVDDDDDDDDDNDDEVTSCQQTLIQVADTRGFKRLMLPHKFILRRNRCFILNNQWPLIRLLAN